MARREIPNFIIINQEQNYKDMAPTQAELRIPIKDRPGQFISFPQSIKSAPIEGRLGGRWRVIATNGEKPLPKDHVPLDQIPRKLSFRGTPSS